MGGGLGSRWAKAKRVEGGQFVSGRSRRFKEGRLSLPASCLCFCHSSGCIPR